MHNFVDQAVIAGARVTSDGFLVADCLIARAGVQRYLGLEVGRPDLPFVDVYRPVEEVFETSSLHSFSHIPVTLDHPSTPVTAENWKELAVGEVSAEVLRDGERLKVPLVLKDARAVDAVVVGKRQLSAGYSASLEFVAGHSPDGTPYQAIQRGIRANHVAIVDQARAGPEFRIGDGNWGAPPREVPQRTGEDDMNQPVFRTIVVDGLSVQTTEQGAEAIAKLQGSLQESASQLASAQTAHAAAIQAKEAEIGELKVKVADTEKKVPTAEALDVLAQKRAGLIEDAKKVAKDLKTEGLTDENIRRAAVTAVYGADMVKDSTDAEVAGMFKAAVGSVKKDPVRDAFKGSHSDYKTAEEDHGQSAYEARLRDAYKPAKSA